VLEALREMTVLPNLSKPGASYCNAKKETYETMKTEIFCPKSLETRFFTLGYHSHPTLPIGILSVWLRKKQCAEDNCFCLSQFDKTCKPNQ